MTGLTPLHYASKEGHKATIEALIAVGSDVHAKDSVRWAECDTLFERSGNILELMFLRENCSIHISAHSIPARFYRDTLGCSFWQERLHVGTGLARSRRTCQSQGRSSWLTHNECRNFGQIRIIYIHTRTVHWAEWGHPIAFGGFLWPHKLHRATGLPRRRRTCQIQGMSSCLTHNESRNVRQIRITCIHTRTLHWVEWGHPVAFGGFLGPHKLDRATGLPRGRRTCQRQGRSS